MLVATQNAYHGDVVVWSDDHGKRYSCTMDLHKSGMDEGSIAELRNGSVMAILRTNLGGGRFRYSISHDGNPICVCTKHIKPNKLALAHKVLPGRRRDVRGHSSPSRSRDTDL